MLRMHQYKTVSSQCVCDVMLTAFEMTADWLSLSHMTALLTVDWLSHITDCVSYIRPGTSGHLSCLLLLNLQF